MEMFSFDIPYKPFKIKYKVFTQTKSFSLYFEFVKTSQSSFNCYFDWFLISFTLFSVDLFLLLHFFFFLLNWVLNSHRINTNVIFINRTLIHHIRINVFFLNFLKVVRTTRVVCVDWISESSQQRFTSLCIGFIKIYARNWWFDFVFVCIVYIGGFVRR